MRARWVLMMLLSCWLPHTTNSEDVCKDEIKFVCVAAGDNVSVPCPKLTSRHVIVNLYKGDEVIYNHTCVRTEQAPNCKPRYTRAGVELHESAGNKSFSFTVAVANASSYGVYGCEGTNVYPPPYGKSTLRVVVLVEGHQCNLNPPIVNRTPAPSGDQKDGFPWIWILVLVLLCIYSLTITMIASVIWVKWRGSDSQSDYMNTKPKAHKDRKKKRGVQIPIPRNF